MKSFEKEKKSKRVILLSHNFSPEPTGIGKYNGEMMTWLAKSGYDCTVVTTFPYYPYWKVQPPYKNRWYKKESVKCSDDNNPITVYRCPSYVPANPTGVKRIIQDFSFWSSMFWVVLKLILSRHKFDLIITIAPPFHLAYLGLMLKKFNGGKLIYHIQDLQIEAAQDLNMLSSQRFFDQIYKIEKDIMRKADFVSSISEGMIAKIKSKIDKQVYFFPNWVDTAVFYPLDYRSQLKVKWGYHENDIVFLYSGAIGEKQGLENLLESAQQVQNNHNIKFIICGSGPYKEKLRIIAEEKNINNVQFMPVQDKELFNEFLNMADVHLILQKGGAGDLVMPSKLTTILAVGGVSLVTAAQRTSLHDVVQKYNLGYIIEPDDKEKLTNAIKSLVADNEMELIRNNARNYALKNLNIDNVMNQFAINFLN